MNKKSLIFIIFAFAILFLSCQKKVKKHDQVLRISFLEGGVQSLHPLHILNCDAVTISKSLFEGLTRINLEGEPELAIAKKIEVSSCGKKYHIFLHATKWSNGAPLTSHHFVQAWRNAIVSKASLYGKRFFPIKNAQKAFKGECSEEDIKLYCPNDLEMEVELENPTPHFLRLLAIPAYGPLYSNNEEEPSVFNGPFLLEKLNIESQIVYCPPLRSSSFFRRKLEYKPKKGEINETAKMG